jgi:hypothetical protein
MWLLLELAFRRNIASIFRLVKMSQVGTALAVNQQLKHAAKKHYMGKAAIEWDTREMGGGKWVELCCRHLSRYMT